MEKARNRICFRLRKVDADLLDALDGVEDSVISELARDGLRLLLGMKTTKRVEVNDRVITPVETKKTTVDAPSPSNHQVITSRTQPVLPKPLTPRRQQ